MAGRAFLKGSSFLRRHPSIQPIISFFIYLNYWKDEFVVVNSVKVRYNYQEIRNLNCNILTALLVFV